VSAPSSRVAAFVLAPALLLGGCLGSIMLLGTAQQSQASACGPSGPGVIVDAASIPTGSVAGYAGVQLVNAAYVMNAAQALGLSQRAQTIAVMTAMGESSLTIVDHGDAAGPDSRGLFQQRANGAWGSYEDRMNPANSATNFYRALTAVQGWEMLPPTIAAHRTQRNADPYHYERYWTPAVQVVAALAGVEVTEAPGTGGLPCTGTSPGGVSADGWIKPAIGPITSNFGMRVQPVTGQYRLHAGTDIGAPCEAPIYAAADGVVVKAGPAGGYGNLITIDHGGDVQTRYAHMYNNGVLVRVGDQVTAGQQVALIGSSGGISTGCHLHYEVRAGGEFTNPVPFMAQRGVPLG